MDTTTPQFTPSAPTPQRPTRQLAVLSGAVTILALAVAYLLLTRPAVAPTNEEEMTVQNQQEQTAGESAAMADWKTYTNEEFGFEVQIPADWTVDAISKDELFFYSDESVRKNASRNEMCKTPINGEDLALECSQRNLDMYFSSGSQGSNTASKVSINNVEWSVIEGENSGWRYESERNGHFYSFKLPYLPENQAKLIKFLSTFKFTNTLETSGWHTYQNSEYGFTFNYPVAFDTREIPLAETYPFRSYEEPLGDLLKSLRLTPQADKIHNPTIEILIYRSDSKTLAGWLAENASLEQGFATKARADFNGTSFIKFTGPAGDLVPGSMYLTSNNQFIFQFNEGTDLTGNTKISLDKIFSTFKFTN